MLCLALVRLARRKLYLVRMALLLVKIYLPSLLHHHHVNHIYLTVFHYPEDLKVMVNTVFASPQTTIASRLVIRIVLDLPTSFLFFYF